MVRYREANGLIISLSYSGVPRHSDRHQSEFCMFAVLRICRVLTGQNLVPQHFSIAHYRSEGAARASWRRQSASRLVARALVVLPAVPAKPLLLMHYGLYRGQGKADAGCPYYARHEMALIGVCH